MTVRVRFAPSPTGYLHVGGLRTALYNYLFAKQRGGKFVLRIEDTDRSRYVEGAIENLIESLRWCGLDYDEGPDVGGPFGPYIQSQRLEIYRKYIAELIEKGFAYYAFDTPEELEEMRRVQRQKGLPTVLYDREKMRNSLKMSESELKERLESEPYVVRLKVPRERGVFVVRDLIRGEISFSAENVDDQILLKSDGYPTYHLANVVDDHLMGITHVIRGEEWLSSTPRHLVLYEYFGWEPPQMIHLPLLLNRDRSKLSKRQNDVAVEDYRKKGYLPEALVNFVALLGWSPGDDREFFTMSELIESFSLERINKSGAIFDLDKLNWLNRQHLRRKPLDELAGELRELLEERGIEIPSEQFLKRTLEMMLERLHRLPDLLEQGKFFFVDPEEFDPKALKKRWKSDSAQILGEVKERLSSLENFQRGEIESALKKYLQERSLKPSALFPLLRIAITGGLYGPDLLDMLELFGRETTLRRIENLLKKMG